MLHTGSRTNVYDEKGTVLYRAVPESSPAVSGKVEDVSEKDIDAVTDFSTSVPPSISVMNIIASQSMRSRTLMRSKTLQGSYPRVANASAAATKKEALKLIQNSLTPEQALLTLFPPEPLYENKDGGKKEKKDVIFADLAASTVCTLREPNEQRWMKVAAIDHTSRLDCVHLQDHLERRCIEENARSSGVVCPIREGIYTDGLKELIRQTTVLCPERGLLLAELATEMQQTTNKYDILFDSACQYAVRKAIERDMRSYLFEDKVNMESEVRRLENRVNELRAKRDGMLKRFEELKQAEQNRHDEEVKYLKKVNQQIISEIKRITALEKAKATAAAEQAHTQNTV
ncbi:putative dynein arm light chain, axonemal [Trypanosoma rangeli]|uniref:Putative dynein arm light chain, axonemal n=1 Tax=Trypanosoma rangeli TaxID=5698 RepID=A0A3R7MN26_TRYRA|nr:putative dynein arm light chain, axonemal [Trypanosoma rangeli]RNF08544.1 putative dynein arm light chain, axonemal [Trypanosoma rangeli]|eukprot:RNF08544.1 putative dynein arm light chain, axonemal [Trypanosoma rangeli]